MRQYQAIHARAGRDRQERLRREADARPVRSRYRIWGALLMSGAVLVTGAGAGAEAANGADRTVASKTTEADIDAVPGLRGQLQRQAEAGVDPKTGRVRESDTSGSPGVDSGDADIPPRGLLALTAMVTAAAAAAGGVLHRRRRLSHHLG